MVAAAARPTVAGVLRVAARVYAVLALVTAGLIGIAVTALQRFEARPEGVWCTDRPDGALMAENPAPGPELSWFPFGTRCVYPAIDGGTIVVPPTDWTATIHLAVAAVFVVTAIAALVASELSARSSARSRALRTG